MIDLRIANGFSKIYLFQHITKLKGAAVRAYFITLSGLIGLMIAAFCFLELTEDFFQASLTNALFRFWCDLDFSFLFVPGNVSFVPEFINEIAHAVFLIGEFILPVQLVHPVQRL